MGELIVPLLIVLAGIVVLSILIRIVFKRSFKDIIWDWLSQLF